MFNIKPENTIAAQLLYMRRLKCLQDRVDRVVRLGLRNISLSKSAYATLDEISAEVEGIESCLGVLAYLRRN